MLDLSNVTVRYGDHTAVAAVDLTVADGEVVAVLGPSGCGKSTLLRAVAGLEPLAAGTISWDGADLAGVPTHRRGFALMFQDGQLFDHLTVARNVAYPLQLRPLKIRGTDRSRISARVGELLALTELEGYDDRLPRTLSGGQRQRVALARSLAAAPRMLLLDEPLSALDADLRRILTETHTAAIIVTHDRTEAAVIADRIVDMAEGRLDPAHP